MDMKFSLEIPPALLKDIMVYCEANSIAEVNKFIVKMLRQGFTTEKFGRVPQFENKEPRVIPEVPVKEIEPIPESIPVTPKKEIKKNTNDLYDED